MRGKAAIKYADIVDARITPAYAGKSVDPLLLNFMLGDHPRLCGEKR